MSKQKQIDEECQTIVETANAAAEAAGRTQKARPVPDRNKWVKQQADRSAKQFDKAVRDDKQNRGGE
jgi:hypothetical protein